MKNHNHSNKGILPPAAENVKANFAALLTAWETDPRNVDALYPLAKAVAQSVTKKLADPQRSTAPQRAAVSNSGCNPRMVALRREIMADWQTLRNTYDTAGEWVNSYERAKAATTADAPAVAGAPRPICNDKGDPVTVINQDAAARLDALMHDPLGDGMDIVHQAAAALLEEYDKAAARGDVAPGWVERPYDISKPRKYVLLVGDELELVTVETTPVQEVYRHVRRYCGDNGGSSVSVNGFSYSQLDTLDDAAVDAVDAAIYRRYGKYADLGGYVRGQGSTLPGGPAGMGNASAGLYTVGADDSDIVARAAALLELTPRQSDILSRLYAGQGVETIAKALGVTPQAVYNTVHAIQRRATAADIAPAGWSESDRASCADVARPVAQYTTAGEWVATYASARAASDATAINAGSIRAAAAGKRKTAGGYLWAYTD